MDHSVLLRRLETVQVEIGQAALQAKDRPQPPDEWPLRTVLIHLALVEDVIWQARLKQMVQQDNPHWVWTEPNLDEAVARLADRPLQELAQRFEERRKETIARLENLDDAGWARIGTHATFGKMDVAGLCDRILEHDEEHLVELRKRAE